MFAEYVLILFEKHPKLIVDLRKVKEREREREARRSVWGGGGWGGDLEPFYVCAWQNEPSNP